MLWQKNKIKKVNRGVLYLFTVYDTGAKQTLNKLGFLVVDILALKFYRLLFLRPRRSSWSKVTSGEEESSKMATNVQLSQKESDIKMMCAAEVHLGTKNCNYQMERYVFKRRNDGNLSSSSLPVRSLFVMCVCYDECVSV